MSPSITIRKAVEEKYLNEKEELTTIHGKLRVAIPTNWPGGADSLRSDHFGKCDCFTIIDVDRGKVKDIKVVNNPSHSKDICLSPVDFLMLLGADAVIVNDIGTSPLTNLREAGMEVYQSRSVNVSDVVLEFVLEALTPVPSRRKAANN
jgi:predicted Fe-Mo cluster-binding NifX family protein